MILAATATRRCELLADPTPAEHEVLGAIGYQPNAATLHTDARFLPRDRAGPGQLELRLGAGDRPRRRR